MSMKATEAPQTSEPHEARPPRSLPSSQAAQGGNPKPAGLQQGMTI